MMSYVKKFLFLMAVSLILISCGSNDSADTSCSSNSSCSKTQECKFFGKTAVSGECVERQVCKMDDECSDKRACAASLEGTEKYCGGFLSDFSFKENQELGNGKVNESYNESIELNGQTGAVYFVVKDNNLPDGLMINMDTGDISGTPTKEGEFKFVLIAYNGASDAKYYYNIIKKEKEFTITITASNCTPDCTGKVCGDNGCGGSCGVCETGTCNTDGTACETDNNVTECTEFGYECVNNTNGKTVCSDSLEITGCTYPECSTNGCYKSQCHGDTLAICVEDDENQCLKFVETDCTLENKVCFDDDGIIPLCVEDSCTPDCIGKTCGDDGCGGSCGTCETGTCNTDGTACETDNNVTECTEFGYECVNNTNGKTVCSDSLEITGCTYPKCSTNGCYKSQCHGDTLAICVEDDENQCLKFVETDCTLENKVCFDDDGIIPSCVEDSCTPDCTNKDCGDDGCGGSCGTCEGGTCNASNQCEMDVVINEGDIVISEFIPNPKSVSDADGEWIELYNTTNSAIDLTNLKILTGTSEKELTATNISLEIPANGYFVIAKTTEALLPILNATSGFGLSNSGERTITIKSGETIVDSVTYNGSTEAKSWQKDKDFMEHSFSNDPDAWCKGSTEISVDNTDKGTPGLENLNCP